MGKKILKLIKNFENILIHQLNLESTLILMKKIKLINIQNFVSWPQNEQK